MTIKSKATVKKVKKVEKRSPTFLVIKTIKADIANRVIEANVGERIELSENEVNVLKTFIEL